MRRVTGAVLTGLGAFLLVLAVMARFYLPGQVIKFPLNEYSVTTLRGTDVSYFSASALYEVTGAKVQAVSTTKGDVNAGSSSTAVWNNVTGVFDITNTAPPGVAITISTERLAFNRRTGALVNCCGAEVGTKRPHFSGLGYVFPIGTQKKTYEVYNTTLDKPEPFQYAGTATVDGYGTYKFVQHLTDQRFSSIKLPGSLVGLKQSSVTLPEYITSTITDFISPRTGAPVKEIETLDLFLENPTTGATALTVLDGTLTSTPKSQAAAIKTAKSYGSEILWVEDLGPLIGLIVGVVLLVTGLLMLLLWKREPAEYEYDDEGDEAVATGA